MEKLNKSDLKELERYEQHFKTAKSGYLHGIYNSDIQALIPLYSRLGYHISNISCNSCVLNMFKTIGNIYFKNKK